MRKPRIKPDDPQTFYHVMSRVSQCVFHLDTEKDPEIKEICHRIIHEMAAIYHVEIHAWVLMDNHFHLCLSVEKPTVCETDIAARFEALQIVNVHQKTWYPWLLQKYYRRFCDLSWFMWEIKTRIARTFNQRHKTSGYFWGGRFKSKIIEDEAALLRVMTYVEQNPVRAGVCKKPSEYAWCSAGHTQKQLNEHQPADAPAVGPFREIEERLRAQTYVAWMDHQAELILNPEQKWLQPPQSIESICLSIEEVATWREEFKQAGPSNWKNQGYGSLDFEKSIREDEEAAELELANRRYYALRAKQKAQQAEKNEPFHPTGSWWYEQAPPKAKASRSPE